MRAEKHLARAIREHATRSLASANFGALGEVVNDAPLVVRVIGTGHVLEEDTLYVSDQISPGDLVVGANVALLPMVLGERDVEWAVVATLTRP